MHSPANTVLPQESISVIGVGRGVPRAGHQSMQSFSALQQTPREPTPARPLSEVMSRGVPVYEVSWVAKWMLTPATLCC